MMINKLVMDVEVGLVVPPFLTGQWLIFVYVNNRLAERSGRGSKIEPHPWQNLIHGYLVILVLTALDFSGSSANCPSSPHEENRGRFTADSRLTAR
jgi:hypothetical protein